MAYSSLKELRKIPTTSKLLCSMDVKPLRPIRVVNLYFMKLIISLIRIILMNTLLYNYFQQKKTLYFAVQINMGMRWYRTMPFSTSGLSQQSSVLSTPSPGTSRWTGDCLTRTPAKTNSSGRKSSMLTRQVYC